MYNTFNSKDEEVEWTEEAKNIIYFMSQVVTTVRSFLFNYERYRKLVELYAE